MNQNYQTFDMIEEITRNDGSTYYEITNVEQNGIAELACDRGMIKEVRLLQLNIARTNVLKTYEAYINKTYKFPTLTTLTKWEEWDKPKGKVLDAYNLILKSNHIG